MSEGVHTLFFLKFRTNKIPFNGQKSTPQWIRDKKCRGQAVHHEPKLSKSILTIYYMFLTCIQIPSLSQLQRREVAEERKGWIAVEGTDPPPPAHTTYRTRRARSSIARWWDRQTTSKNLFIFCFRIHIVSWKNVHFERKIKTFKEHVSFSTNKLLSHFLHIL